MTHAAIVADVQLGAKVPRTRVTVTAGESGPGRVIVDMSTDPMEGGRVIVGAQQIAAPLDTLRTLYALLHGLFGHGPVI